MVCKGFLSCLSVSRIGIAGNSVKLPLSCAEGEERVSSSFIVVFAWSASINSKLEQAYSLCLCNLACTVENRKRRIEEGGRHSVPEFSSFSGPALPPGLLKGPMLGFRTWCWGLIIFSSVWTKGPYFQFIVNSLNMFLFLLLWTWAVGVCMVQRILHKFSHPPMPLSHSNENVSFQLPSAIRCCDLSRTHNTSFSIDSMCGICR